MLEEMSSRLASDDADICTRALGRLADVEASMEDFGVEAGSTYEEVTPSHGGLNEICHAVRESLGAELEHRLLVAVEDQANSWLAGASSIVRSLRRLVRTMFASGADAVLIHAHTNGDQAVFALLDDRSGEGSPLGSQQWDDQVVRDQISELGGTLSPIEAATRRQGVVVHLPLTRNTEALGGDAPVTATEEVSS